MKILVVNAFSETKKGNDAFHSFYHALTAALNGCREIIGAEQHDITLRRHDHISDFVVDWEHEVLYSDSKERSRRFDKLDIIFIAGDMKQYPWEPNFFQLITLIHMAEYTKKPMFTCGTGAFAAIYGCATQGVKFYIINGPAGTSTEKFGKVSKYCRGKGSYQCGCLDNETGDVYSYESSSRSWHPVTNIGIYRNAAVGDPTPARHRPLQRKLSRDDHVLSFDQCPEAMDDNECVATVRNKFLQHFSVCKLESPSFIISYTCDWYLNPDGALPLHTGLMVVADGPHGPVMLTGENCLHCTFDVNEGYSAASARTILNAYCVHMMEKFRSLGNLDMKLYPFLFGDRNSGTTFSQATHPPRPMVPPLNTIPVRTRLEHGPERIELPNPTQFEYHPPKAKVVVDKNKIRKQSSFSSGDVHYVRKPHMSHQTRLENFLHKSGQDKMVSLANTIANIKASSDECLSARELTENVERGLALTIEQHTAAQMFTRHTEEPASPSPPPKDSSFEANKLRPKSSTGRLAWSSSWEETRVGPDNKPKRSVSATTRKESTIPALPPSAGKLNEPYIPHIHPKPPQAPAPPKSVRIPYSNPTPYNTYKHFVKLAKEDQTSREYEGTFRGGFLTPYEREVKEYQESKKKFVGGDFKRYFGVASTAMDIRKEGNIRPHGSYPADIGYHKDKPHHGQPWYATAKLYSFEKTKPKFEDLKKGSKASF